MKVSIEKFHQLFAISQIDMDDLDKAVLIVQTLLDKTEAQVLKMSARKFNRLCLMVNNLFTMQMQNLDTSTPQSTVVANGKRYRIVYSPQDINAGQYVEVATFGKEMIYNIHKVMASISVRVKWSWRRFRWVEVETEHEERANDFLKCEFRHAYHAAVFFYALYNLSINSLAPYLEKQMTKEETKALTDSSKILGGFTMPRWYRNLKVSV